MKIYDTHSDIFHNLYKGFSKENPFKNEHLEDLKQGKIVGGIWVIYSDCEFDVVLAHEQALIKFKPYEKQYDVIKGLEGLRNVLDLSMFQKLYDMGIRHASLTWNEQNHLAGGVKSDRDFGVTPLGHQFLAFMNERKMVVDVSHLNEKSFYEVLGTNPPVLIASHSNAYDLCPHVRNLKKEQLLALKEKGGKVGVTAVRNFVSNLPEKQNIDGLVDHIDYIVSLIGIDNVMLGLDMMNYLDSFKNANLDDLKTHADANKIVDALYKRGYSQTSIEKICFRNFLTIKDKVKL